MSIYFSVFAIFTPETDASGSFVDNLYPSAIFLNFGPRTEERSLRENDTPLTPESLSLSIESLPGLIPVETFLSLLASLLYLRSIAPLRNLRSKFF